MKRAGVTGHYDYQFINFYTFNIQSVMSTEPAANWEDILHNNIRPSEGQPAGKVLAA
jgi:hypothetical protein